MQEEAFLDWLKQEVSRRGSQLIAAKAWGISPQLLNDVLHGNRRFGDGTLERMGWRRVVNYEKKEN